MVNICVVPGCDSNRSKGNKTSLFSAPKDPVRREEWRKIITIKRLEPFHKICSKHFRSKDIRWFSEYFDAAGNLIGKFKLRQPQLSKDASPFIVSNNNGRSLLETDHQYATENHENLHLGLQSKNHSDHNYTQHALQEICIGNQENLLEPKSSIAGVISDDENLPSASHCSTVFEVANLQEAQELSPHDRPVERQIYASQKETDYELSSGFNCTYDKEVQLHENVPSNPCTQFHDLNDSQSVMLEDGKNNFGSLQNTIEDEIIASSEKSLSPCSQLFFISDSGNLCMEAMTVETTICQENDFEMSENIQSDLDQLWPNNHLCDTSMSHETTQSNTSSIIFDGTISSLEELSSRSNVEHVSVRNESFSHIELQESELPNYENSTPSVGETMDDSPSRQYPMHDEGQHDSTERLRENFKSSADDVRSQIPLDSSGKADEPHGRERLSNTDDIFARFHDNLSEIKFPDPWHIHSTLEKGFISVFEIQDQDKDASRIIIRKSMCIEKNMNVSYCVFGKKISACKFKLREQIEDVNEFQVAFNSFLNLGLCCGIADIKDVALVQDKIGYNDALGLLRHNACELTSFSHRCKACSVVTKTVSQRKRRMSKRNTAPQKTNTSDFSNPNLLHKWKKKMIMQRQSLRRKNVTIKNLRNRISDMRNKIENVDIEGLIGKCAKNKIPEVQITLMKQIVDAAKCKSSKGLRYDENWIMLCLLLHIQSPKQYRFIRHLNLMPLPCPQSIRRYLSLIDFKCGFDQNFFKVFKKHMDGKNPRQKHGLILIDEITLRESISVNASTLNYQGLVDFGEGARQATSINEKAKTALVIMFQPLADTYTQPVAVFASSGPVKGVELAKIVASAILNLENCGAKIHGIVCDGAETNRKMWREFGISGGLSNAKNWCEHPLYENRKLFFFSDTPHLVKNVRNRVHKHNLKMDAGRSPIKWQHFETLYKTDSSLCGSRLRVCPKISEAHIYLTNSAKMRVPLATQLFSRSVACGFYVYRSFPGFEDSHETRIFSLFINDLFDALNRKHSCQGVSPGSKDYLFLQYALAWLNNWELNVHKGRISKDEFLTNSTAEGLRVTIMSTLGMVDYLTAEHGFSYVLTGKINQDALEKFFGSSREACGSDEHPATPTFLMIYKLLSVFSILKPPRYGNCSVIEDTLPETLIKISDLKEIYSSQKVSRLDELKTKLDGLIDHDEWEFTDVVEHDYSQAPIIDCVVYYVTGYLIRQIQKRTKCERCRDALVKPMASDTLPIEELVNLKSRRGLIHSNVHFFKMINRLEEIFAKNAERTDAYEMTVTEMLTNYSFTFPCREHATEILAYSIKYYLCMRMRQFTRQNNANVKKQSAEKKKISRLYKT